MSAVFVSYRRGDSEGQARAIYNDLVDLLGRDAVFMDVDSIAPGRDFRASLQEHLASCGCVLALIGPEWLDASDDAGRRRLDNANDFVRLELAAALKRNIPVTPVLLRGAQMPAPAQLPEDIRDLAYRNAFEISHTRWDSDFNELVRRLGLRPSAPTTAGAEHRRLPWIVMGAAAAMAALAGGMFVWTVRTDAPPRSVPVEVTTPTTTEPPPVTPSAGPVELPYGEDTCLAGFVWRAAGPDDHVCVPPDARDAAAAQNSLAASRRSPGGGAYGPDTCLQGYVWRNAFAGDVTCVSAEERDRAAQENALGPARRMRP